MERIKAEVKKLIERDEDKDHLISMFNGYLYMVEYIKGDVNWMLHMKRKLLEKF